MILVSKDNKRAIGTLIILVFFILASIGVYLLREQVLNQEVIVTSIGGRLQPPNSNLALAVSYIVSPKTPMEYAQGDTIYTILYLQGDGTVNNIVLNTKGFDITSVAPVLPLRVDNFSESQIIVLGITVLKCCYQGNVSISVNTST
ncbi:MAG: hypothetical protein ACHQ1H_09900 [Nitrososphaerales archaeon]